MKILIIYENVPESTDLYLVDVTDAEWKWMQLTHRCYINVAMPKKNEEACLQLSKWLEGKQKLDGKSKKPVLLGGVHACVLTGFLM